MRGTARKTSHANSILRSYARIRAGPAKGSAISWGPRGISHVYFCEKKPGAISLSPFLLLVFLSLDVCRFQSARDYRYRLPPPLTSRTTVLRNAGNWRPRETREERGRKKNRHGGGRRWRFMTSFTIFLYMWIPPIAGPQGDKRSEQRTKGHRGNIARRNIGQILSKMLVRQKHEIKGKGILKNIYCTIHIKYY